jgi:hypothetical protein
MADAKPTFTFEYKQHDGLNDGRYATTFVPGSLRG